MRHRCRERSRRRVSACLFAACSALCASAPAQTAPGRALPAPCDARTPPGAEGACAHPIRRKVVLFAGYPALERALRKALVPWRMRVEVSDREAPGASMPRSSVRSRQLSEELGADALVWISTGPDGTALWVQDAQTANLTTRAIADPPFAEPLAAALALSVKTILASSGLAPPETEEAASGTRAPAEEPATLASPEPTEVSRAQEERVKAPAAAPPPLLPRATEARPHAPEPAATAQLVLFGGARFGAFHPAENGARYGVELRWFPRAASESWQRLLWGAASVETSTPWTLSRSNFRGQYWEFAPALALGLAGTVAGGLHLGGSFQFALHWVSISGTRLDDSAKVEKSKYSPALAARPEVGWRFGAATLLFQPTIGYFSRRQLYVQSGSSILQTQPIWWMLGGAFALQWR
jgi:hypothetical protein